MKIQQLHPNFVLPTRSTSQSAGYDLYMPEPGSLFGDEVKSVRLGFAAAIPDGYCGLLLPRSGVGAKRGVELNNTCGVIDSDYRGEWMAKLRLKNPEHDFYWDTGDRVLQVLFIPVVAFDLEVVRSLTDSERGTGGFGSTGI